MPYREQPEELTHPFETPTEVSLKKQLKEEKELTRKLEAESRNLRTKARFDTYWIPFCIGLVILVAGGLGITGIVHCIRNPEPHYCYIHDNTHSSLEDYGRYQLVEVLPLSPDNTVGYYSTIREARVVSEAINCPFGIESIIPSSTGED